jgi:hypothetical protein
LPGCSSFPGVDDHLVEPEVTRNEIIGGERVVALPSEPPQARQKVLTNYVLRGHIVPGYGTAADLLTRYDEESDFGTDACAYKVGVDPETDTRYLEEMAFLVVSEQNARLVREKAVRMHRRGVRRIFAILVEGVQQVCEWSPESQNWRALDRGSLIEDPCLVRPFAVETLFDPGLADNAVAEALYAKGNPVLRNWVELGRAKGRAEAEVQGWAETILKFLKARDLAVSPAQQQEILGCHDLARLDQWSSRAAVASSTDELLSEP